MTREEAITILKDLWRYEHTEYTDKEVRNALDIAIKELEQETVAENATTEQFGNSDKLGTTKKNLVVAEQEPKTEWIDGLIVKVLEEVDGGTDDKYIKYADICNRVEKGIREYCGCRMESEE